MAMKSVVAKVAGVSVLLVGGVMGSHALISAQNNPDPVVSPSPVIEVQSQTEYVTNPTSEAITTASNTQTLPVTHTPTPTPVTFSCEEQKQMINDEYNKKIEAIKRDNLTVTKEKEDALKDCINQKMAEGVSMVEASMQCSPSSNGLSNEQKLVALSEQIQAIQSERDAKLATVESTCI